MNPTAAAVPGAVALQPQPPIEQNDLDTDQPPVEQDDINTVQPSPHDTNNPVDRAAGEEDDTDEDEEDEDDEEEELEESRADPNYNRVGVFRLLEMPREIRDHIYDDCLMLEEVRIHVTPDTSAVPSPPANYSSLVPNWVPLSAYGQLPPPLPPPPQMYGHLSQTNYGPQQPSLVPAMAAPAVLNQLTQTHYGAQQPVFVPGTAAAAVPPQQATTVPGTAANPSHLNMIGHPVAQSLPNSLSTTMAYSTTNTLGSGLAVPLAPVVTTAMTPGSYVAPGLPSVLFPAAMPPSVAPPTANSDRDDDTGSTVPKAYVKYRVRPELLIANKQVAAEYLERCKKKMVLVIKDYDEYNFHPFLLADKFLGITSLQLYLIFFCQQGCAKYDHSTFARCKAVQELHRHRKWIPPLLESMTQLKSLEIHGHLCFDPFQTNTISRPLPCEIHIASMLDYLLRYPHLQLLRLLSWNYMHQPELNGPGKILYEWRHGTIQLNILGERPVKRTRRSKRIVTA